MCLTEGIVRDLSGLNGSAKPWSCYPQELMPTEHIVALLIAERDKLLGCRFEPGVISRVSGHSLSLPRFETYG
jgi:hypothetical protein